MAAGPLFAHPTRTAADPAQLMWSHNTAAWVGVVLCIIILLVWHHLDATVWAKDRKRKRGADSP
jgi:hypothetical protein